MKILYIITKSNFGGAQQYVYDLAVAAKQSGHEVFVASGGQGELMVQLQEAGIPTYQISGFQRDIHLLKEMHSLKELYWLCKKLRPRVVHLNSSKAGLLGAIAARLLKIPRVIFTAHGWPYKEERNMLWKAAAYAGSWLTAVLAHKVIVVSGDDLLHAPLLTSAKCAVIRTAVPPISFLSRENARAALFAEEIRKKHTSDLWLLTTAELSPNKNLFTAIDAVAKYNETAAQKIFYAIIGAGELNTQLEKHIARHRAKHAISLLGFIPNARTYLKAFDLFLLPSKKEGLPYAVLEAGAAELPVIASKVGGIPEIIEHNVSGILVNPHNADEFAEALKTLAASSHEREKYAAALHEKVQRSFALKSMVSETFALYT